MKSNREERKPGQRKLQNWRKLLLIAILTTAGLLISGAIVIIGMSDYLESISHMDTLDKLERTGLIIFIIVLSTLITFLMDRHWETSKKGLPAEKNEITTEENRAAAQGWTKWYTYATGGPIRRLCCVAAVLLITNAILWPFWNDVKLSGALLINALILVLYPLFQEKITRWSRKDR